jgi:hypothetical protein
MTQDESWRRKYEEVVEFVEKNKRNPSRYDDEERGRYGNWLRHNRKLYNAGLLKEERVEKFRDMMEMKERYRRRNQYR